MNARDFITVGMFAGRPEAEVSRAFLEAAGLEALVRADDAGGYEPQLGLTNGVRLLVRAPYAAVAVGLLEPSEPGDEYRAPRWVTSVAAVLAGILVLLMSLPVVVSIVRAIA
jgi:hypothetical protein